jgi:hypothetical protein
MVPVLGSTIGLVDHKQVVLHGTRTVGVLAVETAGKVVLSGRMTLEAAAWVVQQGLRQEMLALAATHTRQKSRVQLHIDGLDSLMVHCVADGPEALSPATRGAVRYPRRWLLG